ncbi:hypothetical protein C2W58_02214 [Bacillus pumilus]|nr:hypothetical protein C2W58_02214 [Bacillus pumilus]
MDDTHTRILSTARIFHWFSCFSFLTAITLPVIIFIRTIPTSSFIIISQMRCT